MLALVDTPMVDSLNVQLDAVRIIDSFGFQSRAVHLVVQLLDRLPSPVDSDEWFDSVERARADIADELVVMLGDHAAVSHLEHVIVDAQRSKLGRLCAARSLVDLEQRDRAESLLSQLIDQPRQRIDAVLADDKDDALVGLIYLTGISWT